MKKIYLILATIAGVVLTSCSSDDLIDTSPVNNVEGESPIVFGSLSKGFTRADFTGRDAATKLGNKFVVSGYKGTKALWNDDDNSIVFDNYLVEYNENSAHTSESNSTNWEYAGITPIVHAALNGIKSQKTKYWDYTAKEYNFIAWSTGTKDTIYTVPSTGIPEGKVQVSAITPKTATGPDATIAYTFTGKAVDLQDCYISDLVTVKKANYGDKPVELKFRQLGTKVRIGFYETIPGYSVKNVKFYPKGTKLDSKEDITSTATIFSAGADIYTEGTYTVTFPTVDTDSLDNNQAHVSFTPKVGVDQPSVVNFGTMNYTTREEAEKDANGKVYLARTSQYPTYAGKSEDNYYVVYLPNENGTNLNLRVDFTLESTDGSKEEINVKNARAQVPSIYTQWKPGFAYTYLFKISDKTNGRTGDYDPTKEDDDDENSDPAGLYPITFDAVVVNAEDNDNTQETITLVSTPSITTYQNGSNVVKSNEYTVLTPNASKGITGDIYVTVNEGNDIVALTDKAALYQIPNGKTEAEVIDALSIQDDYPAEGTIKGRNYMVLTAATKVNSYADLAANKYMLTDSVKFGADGNGIPVGTNKALCFTPAASTTYAFVYTKTAPSEFYDKFEAVTPTPDETVVADKYRDFNLTAAEGDAKGGVNYKNKKEDGVLVDTVLYLGQSVAGVGLFTRTGAGTEESPSAIVAGVAASGTTYYFKDGADYKEALLIPYADFDNEADLFTESGGVYTAKAEDAVPGPGYYKRTGAGTEESPYVYTLCVILPQQANGFYSFDYNEESPFKYACLDGEKAIAGHKYWDKYTQNNGVYYTKVIKVQ